MHNRYTKDWHNKEYSTSTAISKNECNCGSSDGNILYDDGHHWCYVCDTYTPPSQDFNSLDFRDERIDNVLNFNTPPEDNTLDIDLKDSMLGPIKDRNIIKETVAHYKVRLDLDEHGVVTHHHYPYMSKDGDIIAYKTRTVKGKDFNINGPSRKSTLFGQSAFTTGGKYITLCEGEIDTMAVFQMNGSRHPTVGVKSSSEAYKNCKRSFDWLNSFDNVIICFDMDEPGQKAAKQVASLFPKKAKIVKLGLGDAGEYLEGHKEKDFIELWWSAEMYKPDDILGGEAAMWDIIITPRAEAAFLYPWDRLNDVTYGMRKGEFTIITAGSGTGKTQVLREISYHVLKNSESKVGLIYLEETAWETARGLLSIDLDKPTHLPDTHVTDTELREANGRTWGTDRVFTLGDSWRDNNVDYICDKIKYFAKGLDCELIILDHISFMVSDNNGDERKMLDEIGHKLKALSIELDIHLLTVAHSRRQSAKPLEEGGITSLSDLRGTAGLGQLANIVMGLERDGQHEDEEIRNTTLVRVLKNRFSGITGPTSYLKYNRDTGRLTETEKVTEEKEDA